MGVTSNFSKFSKNTIKLFIGPKKQFMRSFKTYNLRFDVFVLDRFSKIAISQETSISLHRLTKLVNQLPNLNNFFIEIVRSDLSFRMQAGLF